MRPPRLRVLACSTLVIGALAAGCTGPTPGEVRTDASSSVAYPSSSMQDWVSYGDVTAFIRVDGETAEPESEAVQKTGEGLVNRTVDVTVLRTLWQRKPSLVLPDTLRTGAWGWIVHDGRRQPTTDRGGSRLEVGHKYVATFTSSGLNPGWSVLGTAAVIPFDGERAGVGERHGGDSSPGQGFDEVYGISLDQFAARLAAVPPHPVAVKYGELPARERYAKVVAEG